MHFRIGINVGDVMVKDGDIFGDGVNIAARLRGPGRAGRHLRHARRPRPSARPRRHALRGSRRAQRQEHRPAGARLPRDLRPARRAELPAGLRPSRACERAEPRRRPAAESPSDSVGDRLLAIRPGERRRRRISHLPRALSGRRIRRSRQGAPARRLGGRRPRRRARLLGTVRDSGDAAMLRAYLEKYPRRRVHAASPRSCSAEARCATPYAA